jgi:hypothetical protein
MYLNLCSRPVDVLGGVCYNIPMVLLSGDAIEEKKSKDFRLREEEDLAQILAQRYGIPYADLSSIAINTDALLYPKMMLEKASLLSSIW